MNKTIAAELIAAREVVRDKIRSLKEDLEESRIRSETAYAPIARPLQDIVAKLDTAPLLSIPKRSLSPKEEKLISKIQRYSPDISDVPAKTETEYFIRKPKVPLKEQRRKFATSTPEKRLVSSPTSSPLGPLAHAEEEVYEVPPGEEEELLDSSEDTGALISDAHNRIERLKDEIEERLESPEVQAALSQFHPLPRTYIVGLTTDLKDDYDRLYGVRETPEGFYIGVSPVHFEDQDIHVGNFKYTGTVGLYDLLFKNERGKFTIQDMRNYKDILLRSNAPYINYIPEAGMTTKDDSEKFQNIIKTIVEGNKPKVHWAKY
nr:uncharacterized protein LOC111418493 isoform X2 [Onthophagus taurus]